MADLLTDRAASALPVGRHSARVEPSSARRDEAPDHHSRVRRRQGWVVGTAAVAFVLLTAVTVGTVFGPPGLQSASTADLLGTVASGAAFVCCAYAAWMTSGALRRSWALFATTMGMWTLADGIWLGYLGGSGSGPLVSFADWLYILGIIPSVLAMVLFPAGTWERGARARLLLDVLTLSTALLFICELLVLDEVLALNIVKDAFIYSVYPVTDILQGSLAVLLLIRTAGRPRLDLTLVGLAFLAWIGTDSGYALLDSRGSDYTVTFVAVGYVVAPLLLAMAALSSPGSALKKRTLQRHATGTVSAMLPDVAVIAAVGTVLVVGLDGYLAWAMAGVTLAFAASRQLVLTSDNHSIRLELGQKVEERTLAVRQLSERHQSILEAVGEGIVGVDESGTIVFVNQAASGMLGWNRNELEGRQACLTLCRDRHDHCVIDMVMRVGELVREAETHYVRRNGTTFPVEITAAPKGGSGGPAGAVIAFRDITERQAMDRMKREFVSAVSHELRTPLTAIRGSLEMLADGDTGELPEEAQYVVDMAARGSERLTRLVNDILDVERLDSGSFDVKPMPQDVVPLVTSTIDALRPLAAESGVTLVADKVSGVALVDADRLAQALTNLVGNAVKFTPAGKVVEVTAEPHGHDIVFGVRDEGRGIPLEQVDSIFDRFHQVEDGDAREKGGTGLGLTITKSIVERHGGHIAVESEVGVGSIFRFSIPAVDD